MAILDERKTEGASDDANTPGTRAYNLAITGRIFNELYNQGYFTAIEKIQEFVGPNFVDRGPNSPRVGKGPQAFAACNELLGAIPGENARWTMDEVVTENNKVVVRWTARKSEHTSTGITIYRFNDHGQLEDAYTEWNASAILKSAGWLPEGIGQPYVEE